MTKQNFDYIQIKNKLNECAQECPELIPAIQNYWTQKTGFTMDEVIPILKDYFSKKYNRVYMIQSRYILADNPPTSIWDEGTHHLTVEYYMHPNSIYILLQNNIIWKRKICSFRKTDENEIILTPMNIYELDEKEKFDNYLETLKSKQEIIWIATEEKDCTFEELADYQNWESQRIPLEDRNINRDLLYPIIISYINERENASLTTKEISGIEQTEHFQKQKT